MKKIFTITSTLLLAGCASTQIVPVSKPIPMPAPAPACDYKVAGKCKQSSAADISGNTTLGHNEDEDRVPKAAAIPTPP